MSENNHDGEVQEQVSILNKYKLATTREAIKQYLAKKPEKEREEAIREITSAIDESAIGRPSQSIRDNLWVIVVASFALVLVGSFLTLAVGAFIPAAGKVTPELILTMFTSVSGFLAGLFVPSPVANRRQTTNG
jgi:VIT1/CCC1 family predicted Fe2+/Mn2+ transporter